MTYKCLECGHIFDEGEEGYIREGGSFWGSEYSSKEPCCPLCHGDYEETISCEVCGGAFLADELNEGVCEECIEEEIKQYSNDISGCFEIAKNDLKEIEINGFLANMFEVAAIEEILLNHLLERAKTENIDCTEYINEDKEWFVNQVLKGGENNENC